MICAYELTAAERHTIREGLYELMADFERLAYAAAPLDAVLG